MKHSLHKILLPASQLLLVAVLFFAQHFAFMHELGHESTLTGTESCIVCVIAQDGKLGLSPAAIPLIIVSFLITFVIYAYHASPFLTLHNRLAQTRAPPMGKYADTALIVAL